MDLTSAKFKPWRNGTKDNSKGYGLCVAKKFVMLFSKSWSNIIVQVWYKNDFEEIPFNLTEKFWTTCSDMQNNAIKKWFEKSGIINWEGKKREFKTLYLGDNKFQISLDGE